MNDAANSELESDESLIQNALQMWANYIETGTVMLTAKDAEKAKKPFKSLDLHQMKLVVRLRDLAAQYEKV
jgi:hypothetical protein